MHTYWSKWQSNSSQGITTVLVLVQTWVDPDNTKWHLTPASDFSLQYLISPYSITTESHFKLMRVTEMITNFKLIDALLFWFSWYALASFHSDQHWTKTFQHSFAYSTNILGLTFSLVGHWLHLGWEGVASKIHSRTVSIVLQYNNLSASTTNHINSCIQ